MKDESLEKLFAAYRDTQDEEILARLTELFLPFARTIALKFAGRGAETEDLVQVAALALVRALKRYRIETGVKFVTFASTAIAGEVRNYLRDLAPSVRMRRDARRDLARLSRVQDELTQRYLREPTLKELAEAMEMSAEELLTLLEENESSHPVALDQPVGEDGEATLAGILGTSEQGYADVDARSFFDWALSLLTPQEKQMVVLRFGEALSQRETAKRMNISQMQVSRMERRVLERIRRMQEEEET